MTNQTPFIKQIHPTLPSLTYEYHHSATGKKERSILSIRVVREVAEAKDVREGTSDLRFLHDGRGPFAREVLRTVRTGKDREREGEGEGGEEGKTGMNEKGGDGL